MRTRLAFAALLLPVLCAWAMAAVADDVQAASNGDGRGAVCDKCRWTVAPSARP